MYKSIILFFVYIYLFICLFIYLFIYICGRVFRIPAHAEFDYTARVQHVLHTTGCSLVEVVLDNISLSRLIRVFY